MSMQRTINDIEQQELVWQSKTIAQVEWLLTVLTILYIVTPGADIANKWLILVCLLGFTFFVIGCHYVGQPQQPNMTKVGIEIFVMIGLITWVTWNTGKIESPLVNLFFLVIIISASIQDFQTSLYEVALISACCLFLTFPPLIGTTVSPEVVSRLLNHLFPFWLVAYLAARIARDADYSKRQIKRLLQIDGLTGLWNMRHFWVVFDRELRRAKRRGHPLSILMLDADNLKPVNDIYGHPVGDKLIRYLGVCIRRNIRGADTVARYGGDEFIIMLPDTNCERSLVLAERIRSAVEKTPLALDSGTVPLTVSIGAATYPDHGTDLKSLITAADCALYVSKHRGKNQCAVFTDNEICVMRSPEGKRADQKPATKILPA